MVKLTDEQRAALKASPDGIECEDTQTRRLYCLVDAEVHRRAMLALQQMQDVAAIQQGITDMEAGRVMTIDESRIRVQDVLSRLRQ